MQRKAAFGDKPVRAALSLAARHSSERRNVLSGTRLDDLVVRSDLTAGEPLHSLRSGRDTAHGHQCFPASRPPGVVERVSLLTVAQETRIRKEPPIARARTPCLACFVARDRDPSRSRPIEGRAPLSASPFVSCCPVCCPFAPCSPRPERSDRLAYGALQVLPKVGREGFEPSTLGLRVPCSTN